MNTTEKKNRAPLMAVLTVGIPFFCLITCGVGIYYYWVEVRPLDAWPEEPMERIEAKWLLVEELAEIPGKCEPSGSVLKYKENRREMATLDNARKRLETATAEDPSPILHNLETARGMRRCGDLIETLVGWNIAGEACEYARDKDIPVARELAADRLRVEEILPAIAREVVLGHLMIEEALSPLDGDTESKPGDLIPVFNTKRERLVYRQIYADLFHAAKRHRDDPEELAEIFAGSEDAAKGRSRILTGMGLTYSGAIIGMSKDIEKYDACVASVGGESE